MSDSGSHSATPEARDLIAGIRHILQSSLSTSSWTQYSRVWEEYSVFSTDVLALTPCLPLPVTNLLLFLTKLHRDGKASSTIISAVSALSFIHKARCLQDPSSTFIVKKFIRGLSNCSPRDDIRLPITRQLLYKLVDAVDRVAPSQYLVLLLRALFLTLFHGFFRLGEVVPKSVSSSNVLTYQDMILSRQEATFILRSYKHSTEPCRVVIAAQSSSPYCPVQAITKYIQIRGCYDGPVFTLGPATVFSADLCRQYLRRAFLFCGLDTTRFKGHSFRIGAASDAAQRGHSDAQIRLMGRWRSDAFRKYIRAQF